MKNIESVSGSDLELAGLVRKMEREFTEKPAALSRSSSISSAPTPMRDGATSDPIPTCREDLDKMRMFVKLFEGKTAAGVSLPWFGVKLGKEESSLSSYYIETKAANGQVYGCGYSVHYLFKKLEKGINISNIPCVAASAQLNNQKTEVIYSLQSYGIRGNILVKFFKPTVNENFDVKSFGVMQSAIDGIHNILGDEELSKMVKFEPEPLEFMKPDDLKQL